MDNSVPIVSWTVVENLIALLRACTEQGIDDPTAQPMFDGGLYLQWDSSYFVIGVELANDGTITWTHRRPRHKALGTELDISGLQMKDVASMVARSFAAMEDE